MTIASMRPALAASMASSQNAMDACPPDLAGPALHDGRQGELVVVQHDQVVGVAADVLVVRRGRRRSRRLQQVGRVGELLARPNTTNFARRRSCRSASALTMISAPMPQGSPIVMPIVGRVSSMFPAAAESREPARHAASPS